MNTKILMLIATIPLLLMPIASSYAGDPDQMYMKDKSSTKKTDSIDQTMEKMKHNEQTKIPNPYFFQIGETKFETKRGTVTISGHGAYNPVEKTIYAWGKYSVSIGSRELAGKWNSVNLADGKGNPYGGDSGEHQVHFVGMTIDLTDTKFTGHNAKRESVERGAHQIWIYANADDGDLCVYGSYVGTPSPKYACMITDTISIIK